MNNSEYLQSLVERGDGSLQAWFDAEHVDEPCTFQAEKVHGCAEYVTNLEWMYCNNKSFREYCQWVLKEHPLTFAMTFDTNEDAGEWLMAPHMDAQQDNNGTCPDAMGQSSNGEDSREKLEADVQSFVYDNGWFDCSRQDEEPELDSRPAIKELFIGWLDRQAAITRKTEQAAWIQQANGLIHEANVERDELRDAINVLQNKQPYCYDPDKPLDTIKTIGRYIDELQAKVGELTELNDYHSLQYDLAYEDAERLQVQVDNLTDELAKRDKGIERDYVSREQHDLCRDVATGKIAELEAECDKLQHDYDVRYSLYVESCKHITELEGKVDMLKAERDELKRKLDIAERYEERADEECDECRLHIGELLGELEAERDALAHDLQDCEQQRERLRQALGTAIDHAHEIMQLVDIDKEVAR